MALFLPSSLLNPSLPSSPPNNQNPTKPHPPPPQLSTFRPVPFPIPSLSTTYSPIITPILKLNEENSDHTSDYLFPSLSFSNILFFRSAYNFQVFVGENEPEEKLISRFRREVLRAGVIQESKRRRFFESTQAKKKRKHRDAARRNRKRSRSFNAWAASYSNSKVLSYSSDNGSMLVNVGTSMSAVDLP
ncbi:30S ribosomal protein S21, chloroplastic [Capsicum annuum]|nr:30S ribosomal protein S21, chloroplastic [Capsicum annuum]